ncbi:MAG: antitoxin VapB family protein [Candidatus Micrarchaeota archaeon]
MSQPVNLADDVYEHLTHLKRKQKASYSEVIRDILPKWRARNRGAERKMTLKELVDLVRSEHKGLTPEAHSVDHDLIVYGVSRAHRR